MGRRPSTLRPASSVLTLARPVSGCEGLEAWRTNALLCPPLLVVLRAYINKCGRLPMGGSSSPLYRPLSVWRGDGDRQLTNLKAGSWGEQGGGGSPPPGPGHQNGRPLGRFVMLMLGGDMDPLVRCRARLLSQTKDELARLVGVEADVVSTVNKIARLNRQLVANTSSFRPLYLAKLGVCILLSLRGELGDNGYASPPWCVRSPPPIPFRSPPLSTHSSLLGWSSRISLFGACRLQVGARSAPGRRRPGALARGIRRKRSFALEVDATRHRCVGFPRGSTCSERYGGRCAGACAMSPDPPSARP